MKDSDKIQDSVIDEFYNENQVKVDKNLKSSYEYKEFKSKLNSTAKKMDVLNEDIFDFHIDTLKIIEQGDSILQNRRAKKEFLMFILSAFILLSLYAVSIIKIGSKILIISQITFIIIAPWLIILISVIRRKGSEV